MSGAQSVPTAYHLQAPAPSHRPSSPHVVGDVVAQLARGSIAPGGTGTHRPTIPGRLQLRQAPAHELSQQTPSVQKPVVHSPLPAQGEPIGLQPPAAHVPPPPPAMPPVPPTPPVPAAPAPPPPPVGWHEPFRQTVPPVHSRSVPQDVAQRFPLHA
jgi:Wiskott-Aldrich syndrome protein